MIPVAAVPEPDSFATIKKAGKAWLAVNRTGRPPATWSRDHRKVLREGFKKLCGYSAMYLPRGTVDHFVSIDEDRSKAYDWTNFRYCDGGINSTKKNVLSKKICDPYKIKPDWFVIILPSLQLVPGRKVPKGRLSQVRATIRLLKLQESEDLVSQREEWYRMYRDGELTLDGLEKKAPLIARAVRRQRGRKS